MSKSLSASERFAALYTVAGELAEFCQVLYPLLIAHADDFGRQSGSSFTVKHVVFPISPRPLTDFEAALGFLREVGLVYLYRDEEDAAVVAIRDFERYQSGLHKRTTSLYPEPPEIPGKSRKFPVKRTEEKRTEQKGREEKDASASPPPRKRPVFAGERLVVFDWQLANLERILGPNLARFDVGSWFHDLDARAVGDGLVIPKRDGGAWLEAQMVAEAQRRGLPLRMADRVRDGPVVVDHVAEAKREADAVRALLAQEQQ